MNRQSESIHSVMEKAFNKILPIPKTPKVYHMPPPHKPLSWVPHGKLGNDIYEERLLHFANEILTINSQRTFTIKYSSRGWCYLLEGLGKIHKGEFNSCQKAINDCRKTGLLPVDFVKGDQDETRRFRGIIEASDPAIALEKVKREVFETLANLPSYTTNYWIDEQYYLMMCVEKGDLLSLFKPICDEYHVPIVSSKGWPPILLRAHIANLSQKAETNRLTPVLLLFYDHDPAGLKITKTFRKNLMDCERGVNWSPLGLIINRFGLNEEDVNKYNLTWIENLKTGSGRESRDYEYIEKYGRRKCESNALFKNDETLNAGQEICRKTIEKYYGEDVRTRFKRKEEASKQKLKHIYDNPLWEHFDSSIGEIIELCSAKKLKEKTRQNTASREKTVTVTVDNKFYGECPRCRDQFNYSRSDSGKLVRCRGCLQLMLLKVKEPEEPEGM